MKKLNLEAITKRNAKKPYGMRWYKRLQVFKGSNNYFDPETIVAYSYDWWQYVKVIKGKLVFNNYNYSSSTNRHQGDMHRLLKKLGLKIDLTVYTRNGLHTDAWKNEALKDAYEKLLNLQLFGSRKKYYTTRGKDWNIIKHPYTEKHLKNDIREVRDEIKLFRSYGGKCTKDELEAMKKDLIDADSTRRAAQRAKYVERKKQLDLLKPAIVDTSPISLFINEANDMRPISLNPNN